MRKLTTSLRNCHHADCHLPIYLAHTISYYPTLRFADKWIWSPKNTTPISLVVYKCLKPHFFICFSICSLYVSHISMAFSWILARGVRLAPVTWLLPARPHASGAQYWGVPTRVRAKEAPPPMASALGAAKTNRKMWRKMWCIHHVFIPSWTIYFI